MSLIFFFMCLIFFSCFLCFFFSSRRRHTRCGRDWSSDVCSSDLNDSASASINVSTPSNSGGGGSTPPSGSGGGDVDFWTLGLLVGLLAVRSKRVKVQAMEQI